MPQCLINLIWIISFLGFCLIQALFINGVHEAFRGKEMNDLNKGTYWEGNILYPIRRHLSKYISEWWQKPLWGCVKCQSSVYGALTYWPTVLYLFGFNFVQIPVFIVNVFILSVLNYIVYKKI